MCMYIAWADSSGPVLLAAIPTRSRLPAAPTSGALSTCLRVIQRIEVFNGWGGGGGRIKGLWVG